MTIVILGGTGVFGSRLARLLCRDGHRVVIAVRGVADAEGLAAEIGAEALQVDRAGDLAPLFQTGADWVIDAAGPFHAYGKDPYQLPRACIRAGVSYMDLSDNTEFCLGISALDAEAHAAGVAILSGVSSVPALSSAAVAALSDGMDRIEMIDSAILPGNRAPRGRSVIRSILDQVGRPVPIAVAGRTEAARGWSDARAYDLPDGVRRRGWMIGVPDLAVFPDHFGAKTVSFRAGLELSVMNRGLAALSWIRARMPLPVPMGVVRFCARLLAPFGSDRGGMAVEVTGPKDGAWIRWRWRLLAEAGDGPFVPAIPARAVLRNAAPPPGARIAVAEIGLAEMEAAMQDLSIRFEREETVLKPISQAQLGEPFQTLPKAVRDSHQTYAVSRLEGRAKVTRGAGLWPRLLGWIFRFPPAVEDGPVTVLKTRREETEIWERRFGPRRFRSTLKIEDGWMTERFGPITFMLDLHVKDGALHFPVRAARIGLIPLPDWSLPISEATETERNGQFRFDVTLRAPLTGQLIVRYQGWLVPTV